MTAFQRAVGRYAPAVPVPNPGRTWPDRRITAAPRWLSTDLRDGNQSLLNPMDPQRKREMFDLLIRMGYREIEVGFPVASRDDHDFLRQLIEQDLIPDDVRISVLVQARDDLIRRTVESLAGAPSATIHLYNATSPLFRRMVFGMDRGQCKELAVRGTRLMLRYAERTLADCDLGFQYSSELFNDTELDFSLEVCEAVMDVWQPGPDRPIVLNFPTTVERATPNVFADQIEWMHTRLSRREHICLSVHPHNDRGTGVAAAEMAVLAGAQRIEGCLFGNGERAGNVDLVTLGLNLFSQGIDPGVDFSDVNGARQVVERCTELPVHPRHPYGGDLVHTAFSGSHQDAIKKGFDEQKRTAARTGVPADEGRWEIPYLPVDPRDIGRTYETVVRINAQSGKGGVAYVINTRLGLNLPRELQIDFAALVQAEADAEGGEIGPDRLTELFTREYLARQSPSAPLPAPAPTVLHIDGAGFAIGAHAHDLERLKRDLAGCRIDLRSVHHLASGPAGPAGVTVYAELQADGRTRWGVGIDPDVRRAGLAAVQAAAARAPAARSSDGCAGVMGVR
ncbi:2-isopropylmalate synthase [Krasilnikovia sp. MM14-A1259]|uniref:2-isopropylmalate synthase n=1 Tax=Krasilnikovia sp. MM14-A1259 TaxID=3373539 RepID=UPI00380C2050